MDPRTQVLQLTPIKEEVHKRRVYILRMVLVGNHHFIIKQAADIAKMISMSLIYPLQLLKSNQQSIEASSTREYQSMRKLVPFIIKQNGIQGLYKGLLTNLFKSVPSTCITFYIYETVNNL